jgi:hypothetical protein
MKMRLSLIVLLLNLMFSPLVFAQDTESDPTAKEVKVKVTFGSEYENDRKNTIVRYMLKDEKGAIYAIKLSIGGFLAKNKNYIEKYSPSMKQVFDKELTVSQTEGNELGIVTFSAIVTTKQKTSVSYLR